MIFFSKLRPEHGYFGGKLQHIEEEEEEEGEREKETVF